MVVTFSDGKMPASTDAVEFGVVWDKVFLYCLICDRPIGEYVSYLNEAIKVWTDHQEAHP